MKVCGTWEEKEVTFRGKYKVTVTLKPWMFLYHGFGMGELLMPDHTKIWTGEPREIAKQFNAEINFVDTLPGY